MRNLRKKVEQMERTRRWAGKEDLPVAKVTSAKISCINISETPVNNARSHFEVRNCLDLLKQLFCYREKNRMVIIPLETKFFSSHPLLK